MFGFTAVTAVPHGTDGVDDPAGRQLVTLGHLGVAGMTAAKRSAFAQQLGAGRAMDRAVHAAAAKERAIGGIDDHVD